MAKYGLRLLGNRQHSAATVYRVAAGARAPNCRLCVAHDGSVHRASTCDSCARFALSTILIHSFICDIWFLWILFSIQWIKNIISELISDFSVGVLIFENWSCWPGGSWFCPSVSWSFLLHIFRLLQMDFFNNIYYIQVCIFMS